jgi:hypothetical protein
VPFPCPTLIKKTVALCFVGMRQTKVSANMNTKPLRFRFGNAICPFVHLFFLIYPALGLTGALGRKL